MITQNSQHYQDSGLDLFISRDSLPDDIAEVEYGCRINAFPSKLSEYCENEEKLIRNSVSFEGLEGIRFKKHVHLKLQHCAEFIEEEINVYQLKNSHEYQLIQRKDDHSESPEDYFVADEKYIHIYTKELSYVSCSVLDCLPRTPEYITMLIYLRFVDGLEAKVYIYDNQLDFKQYRQVYNTHHKITS